MCKFVYKIPLHGHSLTQLFGHCDGDWMDEMVQYVFGTSDAQDVFYFALKRRWAPIPRVYATKKKANRWSPSLKQPWQGKEAGSWIKRQYIVGLMACVIINGSEMGALLGGGGGANSTTGGGGGDHHQLRGVVLVESDHQKKVMMRWSDKRACPPWRMNSFETIVPENLPRPSAHRKSESVSSSTLSSRTSATSPTVKIQST
ncbi:hypothetical protein BVC80_1739g7 [Macleaya cordata]|uniref:Uncharacterized protein n=1 Tax=Macleaya cordata TaxID=56857 RepID=A0A200Q7V4_MACCD|nr:hypothetical protein BVC80_1739g7 [Macleaya cordata]